MEMSALLIFVFGSILPTIEFFSLVRIANGQWDWIFVCVLLVVLLTEALVLYAAYSAQRKDTRGAIAAGAAAGLINIGLIVLALMIGASIAGHMH